jgi:hypothetical protein
VTFAHIGGLPVEETLGSLGPLALVAFGVTWAQLRDRLRRARSHDRPMQPSAERRRARGASRAD